MNALSSDEEALALEVAVDERFDNLPPGMTRRDLVGEYKTLRFPHRKDVSVGRITMALRQAEADVHTNGSGPSAPHPEKEPLGTPKSSDWPVIPVADDIGTVLDSDRPQQFEITDSTGLDKEGRPDMTDMGNAVRLARRYGDRLRYTEATGWFYWDGKRWAPGIQYAKRAAMETAAAIHEEAAAENGKDPARYAALTKWCQGSQASPKVGAMIDWARWISPIFAEPKDFDKDPWLFNANNGTINLRTGKLRPFDATDMMTKLSPVDFKPKATSEFWDDYFTKAFAGKDGLEPFVRRLCGYSLIAERPEDIFLIPHGDGGGGKTTLVNGITTIMGDYAGKLSAKAITQQGAAGHSDELASLAGTRFVVIGETDKVDAIRTGLIKTTTGGEPYIVVSHKGAKSFKMAVSFQFWMPTNEVPPIPSDDTGAWRRIYKLPFTNIFKPAIKGRREVMATGKHAEALLAWAVRGCIEWHRDGLNPPACVIEATQQLRESMDRLDQFFETHVLFAPEATATDFVTTESVMSVYRRWANRNGIPERWQYGPERMAAALKVRHAVQGRERPNNGPRGWLGVKLREGSNYAPTGSFAARPPHLGGSSND